MKLQIKPVFNRAKRLTNEGEGAIHLYSYSPETREKKYYPTGVRVKPNEWDGKKVIGRSNRGLLNDTINSMKLKIEMAESECLKGGLTISHKNIEKSISGEVNKSFNDFIKEENEGEKERLGKGTLINREYVLRFINEIDPSLKMHELDYSFITKFNRLLVSKKYEETTIFKHHGILRTFINLAINHGLIHHTNPYAVFKIKKGVTNKRALYLNELKAIINLKLSERLSKIRDIFIFDCYTGLRYGDIVRLDDSFIKWENDGVFVDILEMDKTPFPVVLPLHELFNGEPLKILKRYYKPGKKFFYFTNTAMNVGLKSIGYMAGLKFPLTFHIGRHTFCTYMAAITGNEYTVMNYSGHQSTESIKGYVDTANKMFKNLQGSNWNLIDSQEE